MRRLTVGVVIVAALAVGAGTAATPSQAVCVASLRYHGVNYVSFRTPLKMPARGALIGNAEVPACKDVILNGEPVTTEFTAPAAGEYEIACSEFCGRGHGQMKAALLSTSATRTSH